MKGSFCPLIKKDCIEHKCMFYTHLIGMNPQTGQPTDEWKCAVAWLPLLLVENSNMSRQVAASMDRNNNIFVSALPDHLQERILSRNKSLIGNGGVS